MLNMKASRLHCEISESQLLAEYDALRSEIIHRMRYRIQILSLAIIVLGAIFAFNRDNGPNILLYYPLFGFFVAAGWANNDYRIKEIGDYIRNHIEEKLPGLNWERYFFDLNKKERPKGTRRQLRATILSASGILVCTQCLSIIGYFTLKTGHWYLNTSLGIWLLLLFDVLSILAAFYVLWWTKFRKQKALYDES